MGNNSDSGDDCTGKPPFSISKSKDPFAWLEEDGIIVRDDRRRARILDAEIFRKGACHNCGEVDHNGRFCLQRPRKKSLRLTGILEEIIKQDIKGKKDIKGKSDDREGDCSGKYICFREMYSNNLMTSFVQMNPDTRLVKEKARSQQFDIGTGASGIADGKNSGSCFRNHKLCSGNFEIYLLVDVVESYSSGEVYYAVNGAVKHFVIRSYKQGFKPTAFMKLQELQVEVQHPNHFKFIVSISDFERGMLWVVYADTEFKLLSLRNMFSVFLKLDFDTKLPFIKVAVYNILSALFYYHNSGHMVGNLNFDTILYDQKSRMFKICGFMECKSESPSYKAPEVIMDSTDDICLASDVWSVGCIFAELLRGKPIFEDELTVIVSIFNGKQMDIEERLMDLIPLLRGDNIASSLLMDMLRYAPAQRIIVKDALEHGFFFIGKDDIHVETMSHSI